MQIRDVMSREVFSCTTDVPLTEAARIMWDRDLGAVPVLDGATGRPCGVLTDRDIAMAAYTQGKPIAEIRVSEAMSRGLHCARPDGDLTQAHALMRHHQVRRLPVLDESDALVGMLTLNDLALAATDGARMATRLDVSETLAAVSRPRSSGAAGTGQAPENASKPVIEMPAAVRE
jgi:CBS domain-containing protein